MTTRLTLAAAALNVLAGTHPDAPAPESVSVQQVTDDVLLVAILTARAVDVAGWAAALGTDLDHYVAPSGGRHVSTEGGVADFRVAVFHVTVAPEEQWEEEQTHV